MTATMDGEFCVFLIGMRINRPLKVHKWLPVMMAMTRMLRELAIHPELGLLGTDFWLGRTVISVQYWRSVEALNQYASSADREHLPAWAAFRKAVGDSGDVGIWHETYRVQPSSYETIYHNMPPFGLGRVGTLVPATGHRQSAQGRIEASIS
jgi:hypothetical protein